MAGDDLPLLTFPDAASFEDWLAKQPDDARGAWLRFAKSGAPEQTVGYRARVERLVAGGRMTPRGSSEVARARADGRWEAAYAPQARAAPDDDLIAALDNRPAARICFDELDAANRYAVLYRVQQAKTPEKRAAKIAELVAMLARGETFHSRKPRRGSRIRV